MKHMNGSVIWQVDKMSEPVLAIDLCHDLARPRHNHKLRAGSPFPDQPPAVSGRPQVESKRNR